MSKSKAKLRRELQDRLIKLQIGHLDVPRPAYEELDKVLSALNALPNNLLLLRGKKAQDAAASLQAIHDMLEKLESPKR